MELADSFGGLDSVYPMQTDIAQNDVWLKSLDKLDRFFATVERNGQKSV
jgi:hypothetical protein